MPATGSQATADNAKGKAAESKQIDSVFIFGQEPLEVEIKEPMTFNPYINSIQ